MVLTIEQVAALVARRNAPAKITGWQIRRCINRGLLPEPQRLGAFRIFTRRDAPKIEAALRVAGYLPKPEPVEAAQ